MVAALQDLLTFGDVNSSRGLCKFKFNDGGRKAAGFKGVTNDCVVRAIAIGMQRPYREVYDEMNEWCKDEKLGKRYRGKSSSRSGVHKPTYKSYLRSKGWVWVPTMFVGQGCKVHLRNDELPRGRLLVQVTRHLTCVIDGTINDTYDCSRNGTRCVYGYWYNPKP